MVDGQQRITALSSVLTWFAERPEAADYQSRAFGLTKHLREFTIPAYQVVQDDVRVLQDIFDRMNNYGKRLSRAEVFSALNAGPESAAGDRLTIDRVAEHIDDRFGFGTLDADTVLRAILARRGPDVQREIRQEFDDANRRSVLEFQNEDKDTAFVKLPDQLYADVPVNEFAMMSMASMIGIEVPEIRLVHRDEIDGLPPDVWAGREEWAYAVRRFDRTATRGAVHMEDLAQVRNVYPDAKYDGNYETVASLIYRGHDVDSLREFARRLTFTILISNGDAHLKNWSVIYTDPRIPVLAPAYDLVSTRYYMGGEETLGMKFAGMRRFDSVRLSAFSRLERRLGITAGLADEAEGVIRRVLEVAPQALDPLAGNPGLKADVAASIVERSRSLRAGAA